MSSLPPRRPVSLQREWPGCLAQRQTLLLGALPRVGGRPGRLGTEYLEEARRISCGFLFLFGLTA